MLTIVVKFRNNNILVQATEDKQFYKKSLAISFC